MTECFDPDRDVRLVKIQYLRAVQWWKPGQFNWLDEPRAVRQEELGDLRILRPGDPHYELPR